jgi:hypothetical protein
MPVPAQLRSPIRDDNDVELAGLDRSVAAGTYIAFAGSVRLHR